MPDVQIYREGPQPGGLFYAPDVWNNREVSQAREPSRCLNGWGNGEWLAKEAFWSPATRGLKEDSDRAITPAPAAVCVPELLLLPGSPQPKQLCHLHVQPSLGQGCHRPKKKKSCVYACGVVSVMSYSLRPYGLWPARLLCQKGSPDKNTGVHWQIQVAIPF